MFDSQRFTLLALGFMSAVSMVFVTTAHAADAPANGPQAATASLGTVRADLAWTRAEDADTGYAGTTGLKLKVTRAGVVALDAPVVVTDCDEPYCTPFDIVTDNELYVGDVDADGEAEVLMYVFSGGAHCCSTLLVYDFDGTTYAQRPLALGNTGVVLRDLDRDGTMELLGNDDRFSYAFDSYAGSWHPPLTRQFVGGKFVDVTRRFPGRIRTDAAEARKIARSICTPKYADSTNLGIWAGWAADQYLLGKRAAALRTLRAEYARGCIKPANSKTLARLDAKLRAWGYARTA